MKWRVNGRQDWEEDQLTVNEVFVGWEEELRIFDQELGSNLVSAVWKEVLTVAENGLGKNKITRNQRGDGQRLLKKDICSRKGVCRKLKTARRWGHDARRRGHDIRRRG